MLLQDTSEIPVLVPSKSFRCFVSGSFALTLLSLHDVINQPPREPGRAPISASRSYRG